MKAELLYSNEYIERIDFSDEWESMMLQQTQLNAVQQQADNEASYGGRETKIAMTIEFKKHLPCADGSTMQLTISQMADVISRMHRRVIKLAARKPRRQADEVNKAFVPSLSGYYNTEYRPYACLMLGVSNNYRGLEFAGLVDSVLGECPYVKSITLISRPVLVDEGDERTWLNYMVNDSFSEFRYEVDE